MRWLLVLAVLALSVPGCCYTSGGVSRAGYDSAGPAPDCAPYTPGYRRACYPAYRPIDSASLP